MSEDWHVVEDVGSSPDVITDLIVLAKKERLPPNYSLVCGRLLARNCTDK